MQRRPASFPWCLNVPATQESWLLHCHWTQHFFIFPLWRFCKTVSLRSCAGHGEGAGSEAASGASAVHDYADSRKQATRWLHIAPVPRTVKVQVARPPRVAGAVGALGSGETVTGTALSGGFVIIWSTGAVVMPTCRQPKNFNPNLAAEPSSVPRHRRDI